MKLVHSVLLAAISLSTLACGGGEYVKKMEEFATSACACKDTACVTKVSQEQADWLSKNADKAAKLSSGDAEKVAASGTKMAECVTKIATGG